MLLYYGPEKLEKLLESLFIDDESTLEDVEVLEGPALFNPFYVCCTYNYAGYDV